MVLDRITSSIFGVVVSTIHLIVIVVLWLTRFSSKWDVIFVTVSWFPVAGLLLWLAVRWPAINYRHSRYRLDANGIEIWSGVVWRDAVFVPRSRIQHIDLSRGPIERSYGLATLAIHTAGTEHSRVELRGLDYGVALALRDALLPKDDEPAV